MCASYSLNLEIEEKDYGKIAPFGEDGEENKKAGYHIRLLINAGYIDGNIAETYDGSIFMIHGLTWKGHELLDDIRDDTVWNQTKATLGENIKSFSIDIIREAAKSTIKGMLGLP